MFNEIKEAWKDFRKIFRKATPRKRLNIICSMLLIAVLGGTASWYYSSFKVSKAEFQTAELKQVVLNLESSVDQHDKKLVLKDRQISELENDVEKYREKNQLLAEEKSELSSEKTELNSRLRVKESLLSNQILQNAAKTGFFLGKPIASASELELPVIVGKTVYISDIPTDERLIRNKKFENCNIIGPAMINALKFTTEKGEKGLGVNYIGCNWNTTDEKRLFLPLDAKYVDKEGVVFFSNVTFQSCSMYKCSLVGTEDLHETFFPNLETGVVKLLPATQ